MIVHNFYLTNETNVPKDVIIEPFHFVEPLEPNDVIEIRLSSDSTLSIETRNPFSIIIKEHTFVIWIDWHLDVSIKRTISFFINNVETFEFDF